MNNNSIVGAEKMLSLRVKFWESMTETRFGNIRVIFTGGSDNSLRVGIWADNNKLYVRDFAGLEIVTKTTLTI